MIEKWTNRKTNIKIDKFKFLKSFQNKFNLRKSYLKNFGPSNRNNLEIVIQMLFMMLGDMIHKGERPLKKFMKRKWKMGNLKNFPMPIKLILAIKIKINSFFESLGKKLRTKIKILKKDQ